MKRRASGGEYNGEVALALGLKFTSSLERTSITEKQVTDYS